MQKLIKALENIMVAVTFAEAGEYDEARKLSMEDQEKESSSEGATLDIKTVKA